MPILQMSRHITKFRTKKPLYYYRGHATFQGSDYRSFRENRKKSHSTLDINPSAHQNYEPTMD